MSLDILEKRKISCTGWEPPQFLCHPASTDQTLLHLCYSRHSKTHMYALLIAGLSRVKYFKMMENNVSVSPCTWTPISCQAKTELLMPNSQLTYYQYRTGMLSMIIYNMPHSESYSASSPSPSDSSCTCHFSIPATQKRISSHIHQG